MAKKKKKDNVTEEDWFDDDDFEEEVKPKKKKGGRKKRKAGKVIAWVIAFIVILAILLFIRFKYTAPAEDDKQAIEEKEEAQTPEVKENVAEKPAKEDTFVESGTYEEPKSAGPDVVEKEEMGEVQNVVDTTVAPELFSNLRCDYDYTDELLYISLRIYNTLDEDIKISPRGVMKGYNTYFLIRGIVDTDPGCDTELLHPGEWTECDRIGFDNERYGNVEGINRISVQVPGKTEALLIECPAKPKSSSEE